MFSPVGPQLDRGLLPLNKITRKLLIVFYSWVDALIQPDDLDLNPKGGASLREVMGHSCHHIGL